MKKTIQTILCVLFLFGCGSKPITEQPVTLPTTSSDYQHMTIIQPDSYTAAVTSEYKLDYGDNTNTIYRYNGVFEGSYSTNPSAHITQNLNANGIVSSAEGYYYNGRLYNNFNTVTYYEDMDWSSLKQTMLVPMAAIQFPEEDIESIEQSADSAGNTVYTIKLKNDKARSWFLDRYDTYGIDSASDLEITDNTIVQTFNADQCLTAETADFVSSITISNQTVTLSFSSTCNLVKLNTTTITISDELMAEQSTYVNYEDIDTSTISSEPVTSEGSTPEEILKNRLVSRLNYTDNGDNTYTTSFNDSEVYTFDFDHSTFTYRRYTIVYVYSWKGDIGSMGACSYNFGNDSGNDNCEESTLSTVQDVKTYFLMELYYCGISLDELVQ